MLNAKSRWLHLRSSAGALETLIWMYRTRVGPFEIELAGAASTKHQPEASLMRLLNAWRADLLVGASLATSELKRKHSPTVYRHYQDTGHPEEGGDDFQSPVPPPQYIKLRVKPMLEFYQQRIPVYARWGTSIQMLILILGVVSSALAHYKQIPFVIIATSGSVALTSWVAQHGQSAPLVSAPARLLHRLRGRPVAPCSSALPG